MTYRKQHETTGRTAVPLPPFRPRATPHGARPAAQPVAQMAARIGGQSPEAQATALARPNRTGLPDVLKSNVEALSGVAMDDVRVHRGSAQPAGLRALAFTQGSDIYLGPGQERHLPHEAWHVVQQKQGRVRPMTRRGDTAINDDARLEAEADTMGALAGRLAPQPARMPDPAAAAAAPSNAVAQCIEVDVERSQKLVKDSQGGKLAGTNFVWKSKFEVTIQNDKVVVTIRIAAATDPELFQDVWAAQVARQWSNRFMLQFDGKNYPIVVELVQVQQGAHYPIKVSNAESALSSGSRGHFGTENMTIWGKHDTTNIAHEVGHMLGNIDEYGVVEVGGKERDYLSNPSTTIMGKPENNPIAEHYYLIQWAAEQELNKKRPVAASGKVLPYVGRLGGLVSLGSSLSMQEVLDVKLKSNPVTPQPAPSLDLAPKLVSKPGKSEAVSQSALPVTAKPKPQLVPKSGKDAVLPERVVPYATKPPLKPVPKPGKDLPEKPSELEEAFAKLRQRQDTASSAPVVEPRRTSTLIESPTEAPPKIIPTVAKPKPQIAPQIQTPKPIVPQIQAPEPEPPQEVSDADIERGRELIDHYYQKALGYLSRYEDEEAMEKTITARFLRIATAYNKADAGAEDYAKTLIALVAMAKASAERVAIHSSTPD